MNLERMRVKVGRNDLCPCGSGRKYKACCLQAHESAVLEFPSEVRKRACDVLYEFSARDQFGHMGEPLLQMFFGPEFADLSNAERTRIVENEACSTNFIYWALFEVTTEGRDRTFARRFLARKGHALPISERCYLEAMSGSHLRLYEVEAVLLDEGLRLRDCWDGTRYEIRERLATHELATHSIVALRLRPEPDGSMVLDGAMFGGLTHPDKDAILSDLRDEWQAVLATDGNADGRFDFYQGPAIARRIVHRFLAPVPQLATTDGEAMKFCKVIFDVVDRDAAEAALERVKELELGDDGYTWIRGKGRVVHASMRFEGGRLVAETHSEKRAIAARRLLERNLGNAIHYQTTDQQDVMAALEEYRRREPARREMREAPAIPDDVQQEILTQVYGKHYRSWIDEPLPALGGKTPREATRNRTDRDVVIGILKDFIASAEMERRRGEYAYDFSWMWGELGIDPSDSTKPQRMYAKGAKRAARDNLMYQLKISLRGAKPPIWRRVLLSGDEWLDRVHAILNRTMGWTDTHLHAFEVDGVHYECPDPDADFPRECDRDERKVRLADLALLEGSSFVYYYDFGDDWTHRVEVERIAASSVTTLPACVAGRRCCPPEDVGGVYGFRDFLNDPERWPEDGPSGFDPEAFDVAEVNEALRGLPKRWQP